MEFIILAVLFIVLLVFISSRIRRVTGQAFEPETFETADFSIFKPEGFIHPVEEKPAHAFEAYSREFGKKSAGNIRQVRAIVDVFPIGAKPAEKGAKIPAEYNMPGQHIYYVETEFEEAGAVLQSIRKVIEVAATGKVYQLEITALKELKDEFMLRIDEMLNSFQVK